MVDSDVLAVHLYELLLVARAEIPEMASAFLAANQAVDTQRRRCMTMQDATFLRLRPQLRAY